MEAVELKTHQIRSHAKVWDPCGVQVGEASRVELESTLGLLEIGPTSRGLGVGATAASRRSLFIFGLPTDMLQISLTIDDPSSPIRPPPV